MKMRNLDSTGDWTFGAGLNNYVFDTNAVKLDVKTAIREWVGDCFFNMDGGIDWINRMEFGQDVQLDLDLRQLILSRPNVTGLNTLSFSYNSTNRLFSVSYDITTVYGTAFNDIVSANA